MKKFGRKNLRNELINEFKVYENNNNIEEENDTNNSYFEVQNDLDSV
jgi:hypothetical protein